MSGKVWFGAVAMAVLLAAAPARAQQGELPFECEHGQTYIEGKNYDLAIEALKKCLAKDGLSMLEQSKAHTRLATAFDMTDRMKELVAELKVVTAEPYVSSPYFWPPTTAMGQIFSIGKWTGVSQPKLIARLASQLAEEGKNAEALAETARALRVARTVRGDTLADQADAWLMRASICQALADSKCMMGGMVRAYVRGVENDTVKAYVDGQSPDAASKLQAMRKTMLEDAPKVSYHDAYQASLDRPIDPKNESVAEAIKRIAQIEADELSLLGPPGID